uniref:Small ribosomal subunit protein uS3c n=1 Tax=Gastrodia menghaiensis TaxID=2587350 RepID=A0A976UFK8_9ASPA|nr:ribosomal protein S3 [Gastrodia menghaiensis]UVG41048.1 ribosomal protein S3 [Gastrodia menghaiensis]
MGQRINPLGFRLVTTQVYHSFWFAKPKYFYMNIQEDVRIRKYIKDYVRKDKRISLYLESIIHIGIKKKISIIKVIIYIGFPNLLIEGQEQGLNRLKMSLKRELIYVNNQLNILIKRIEKPYEQPLIIAEYIALQLKDRVSFRKSIKKAIELTEKTGIKGIQVKISGRIDGKEIARVEWIREGKVPLQRIDAKIDYCSHTIITNHGLLGIKIWIYK